MGLLHAVGGKHFGVTSQRTISGGLKLHAARSFAKGSALLEVPLRSCLAHNSSSLTEGASRPSPAPTGLRELLVPRQRCIGGATSPFKHFGEWYRITSEMRSGLSASTEHGAVYSLHPFEAAAALSILEGASIASPVYASPQWHYIQTLPLAQFLYHGGDPSRRHSIVAELAEGAPQEQVDMFHEAHIALEMIAANLADALLRKYHHTDRDEQLEWMAQASLLCLRSKLMFLPVFGSRPLRPSEACECYRPFIVPGIDMIRHSFDVERQVNTKIYVDLSKGCVRAESVSVIRAGEELFSLHPLPEDEELKGMDGPMRMALRYGISAFI